MLQLEAEERLAVEQAARAEEDARLRELYPLPEDEEGYSEDGEYYDETEAAGQDQLAESIEQTDGEPQQQDEQPAAEDVSNVDTNTTLDEEEAR